MTSDDEPGWRRLTPAEIEDLRAEMRAAGEWAKAELAKRRRERRLEEARRVAQEMKATLSSLADKGATKRVNFDVTPEDHAKLKIYAAKQGKTVKELLTEYVRSLPDE